MWEETNFTPLRNSFIQSKLIEQDIQNPARVLVVLMTGDDLCSRKDILHFLGILFNQQHGNIDINQINNWSEFFKPSFFMHN